MEYILLSATTIGSKELAIGSARLDNNIILESNQASTSIDRLGYSDQEFSSGSPKSGNKMSVGFRRNSYNKIGMNP